MFAIKIIEAGSEPELEGRFIEEYDVTSLDHKGAGRLRTTLDQRLALRFCCHGHALQFYIQDSPTVPFRTDGKPNRPLTAYTVEIASVPDLEVSGCVH